MRSALFVASLVLASVPASAQQMVSRIALPVFGHMPLSITRGPTVKVLGGSERLGKLFGVVQRTPGAGPQAVEGYTLVAHDVGTVGLALGTIGNVEVQGRGRTEQVRALQGGIVVSGPGRVDHAANIVLAGVQKHSDYDGPTDVGRVDYILFGNGWSIRPDGARLLLCDPQNVCRPF